MRRLSGIDRVMLDRGIISNPGLLDRIAAGRNSGGPGTDKETLKAIPPDDIRGATAKSCPETETSCLK